LESNCSIIGKIPPKGESFSDFIAQVLINKVKSKCCGIKVMTKKKLPVRFTGQHFTIDKVLIKDAIRQANISNQDTVLDIGAGKGFLTVHLLKIANNVVAIENDTALVEHLRKLFSDARNVQVVGCDFRNFAVPKFPFKVVSNIPYGITSDIFKILMFESLGNFLGGSIVLQLEPTQKLFSRKLYNPYTVFYHTFFDLKLVYEVGPESFFPPPTVKSALLNIKRKHLFFDFKFKAKYLAFISCLLEKPDLSVKTALKSIFRKSQVRSISEKFGLNLNAQIVCLSPSQWLNCFLEMLEVVPEKFHPS
jgi:23S rRNA (adenine-N6)-dimethyltransferase